MHLLKKAQNKTIGRHLLFWLAYIAYLIIDEGWEHRDTWNFNLRAEMSTEIPVAILMVYLNLYLLMPAFYGKRKYVQYISGLMILLFIGGLMGRFFSWWIWLPLERANETASREPKDFWIIARIIKDAADIFPVVAVTTVLKLMRNSFQNEQKLRQIEKEKFNAEMGLLKAQINPHFFFNTLNSLYALSLARSDKSPDVVMRLSGLMHYMLYEARAEKVLLKDELAHLENYIAIEQMRFADRLELSFQYSGDLDGKMIAPLLLLPFIENAFKHGIEDNAGWITIDLKMTGSRLFLKVENSFKVSGNPATEGMGLSNVKRRLELTYPKEYELSLQENSGIYRADLKINL